MQQEPETYQLANFSRKHLGLSYSTDRKDLVKLYSTEAAEIFLIFKKRAALNIFKNFKNKAQHLQVAASKAAI